jgi:hypothetical protein
VPTEPTGYELQLPKDFVLPQGVEFTLNPNDPMLAEARKIAHRNG